MCCPEMLAEVNVWAAAGGWQAGDPLGHGSCPGGQDAG